MIPVATNHARQIRLAPFIEMRRIALVGREFWNLPLVKGLIHHEKSHPVAERVKLRILRVVRGADRIAAHLP